MSDQQAMVEAAFCQPAETYQRAARRLNDDVVLQRLFTLHYCTIVTVSATSDTARLSHCRCLPYGGVWHAQPTLCGARHDRVRGHCNGTRYPSFSRSVVGTSKQIMCCLSHDPLLPTSIHSQIAVHCGVAMRKSAKHSLFCN